MPESFPATYSRKTSPHCWCIPCRRSGTLPSSPIYSGSHPAQFALANWTFLDAAILSAHAHSPPGEPQIPPPVHVTFVDWIPGICSLFGFLVVNLIDKDRIRGEEGFGDSKAVWRARLFLFIGFALMAGGLAGSAVSGPSPLFWVSSVDNHEFSPCGACRPS